MATKPLELQSLKWPFVGVAVLLALCTGWAVYDEVFPRRPWKGYQREFFQLEENQLKADLARAEKRLEEPDVKAKREALRKELDEAQRAISGNQKERHEYDEVVKAADDAGVKEAEDKLYLGFDKSEQDAIYYKLREARHDEDAKAEEKLQKQYDAVQRKIDEKQRIYDAAIARHQQATKARAAFQARKDKAQAALAAMEKPVEDLKKKIENTSGKWPQMDQYWIQDLKNSWGGPTVDRCQNCHAAVNKAGFSAPWEVLEARKNKMSDADMKGQFALDPEVIDAYQTVQDKICEDLPPAPAAIPPGAGLHRQGHALRFRGGGQGRPLRRETRLPHPSQPLDALGAEPSAGAGGLHRLPRRRGHADQGSRAQGLPPRRGRSLLERPAHRGSGGDGAQVQGRVPAGQVRPVPLPAAQRRAGAASGEGQEAVRRRGMLGLPSHRGLQRSGEARADADQHHREDDAGLAAHLDQLSEGMAASDAHAELLAWRGERGRRAPPGGDEARPGDGRAPQAARAGGVGDRRLPVDRQRPRPVAGGHLAQGRRGQGQADLRLGRVPRLPRGGERRGRAPKRGVPPARLRAQPLERGGQGEARMDLCLGEEPQGAVAADQDAGLAPERRGDRQRHRLSGHAALGAEVPGPAGVRRGPGEAARPAGGAGEGADQQVRLLRLPRHQGLRERAEGGYRADRARAQGSPPARLRRRALFHRRPQASG